MDISKLVFPATYEFDLAEPSSALDFLAPLLNGGTRMIGFHPAMPGPGGRLAYGVFEFDSLEDFREFATEYLAPSYIPEYSRDDPAIVADVDDMVEEFIAANQVKAPTVNINGSSAQALIKGWSETYRALDIAYTLLGINSPHGRDYPAGAGAVKAARSQCDYHRNAVRRARDYAERMMLAIDAQS